MTFAELFRLVVYKTEKANLGFDALKNTAYNIYIHIKIYVNNNIGMVW